MKELNIIIEKLKEKLKDILEHDADFCYVSVDDTRAIIEYLKQLQCIGEYENINKKMYCKNCGAELAERNKYIDGICKECKY